MKHLIYYLVLTLGPVYNYTVAQSSCASIVKNIGFEKRQGNIEYVTKLNTTTALFYAEDQYYGHELWRTDGTEQGTYLVKDIAPGTTSSRGGYEGFTGNITVSDMAGNNKPVVVNGIMYFEANDGIHGYEVWRSDGTEPGTFMLTDVNEDNSNRQGRQTFRSFFIYNNEVYFWDATKRSIIITATGKESSRTWRLFKTKGTIESTTLVSEFPEDEGYIYSQPQLFNYKGILSFVLGPSSFASSTEEPNRFFQINSLGQVTKTKLHTDGIYNLNTANDKLYFTNKKGLFRSDGTEANTVLIRESGSVFTTSLLSTNFWGDGRFVYFIHGGSLWRTDDTMTGTFTIRNGLRVSNTDLDYETRIFIYKNELYFVDHKTKNNVFKGVKLWKTNGTVEGTISIADIDVDSKGQAIIRLLTEIDGNLYFYGKVEGVTADLEAKSGIWKSDGTQAGTKLMCPLGSDLSCLMINPTFEDYGFLAIDKSLLFLGFPDYPNYGDIELYRTSLTNCPTITPTISGATSICPGGSITLSVTATGGTAPYSYQWQQGTSTIATGVTSLAIKDAGVYMVTVTDAQGCVASATQSVTETAGLPVSITGSTTFCAGASTNLTANVSGGTAPFTFQWKQGTSNVGNNSVTYMATVSGNYAVDVSDSKGCKGTSQSVAVSQRPAPATPTVTASTSAIVTGQTATLQANVATGLSTQWLLNDVPIAGATQSTFTASQGGKYAARATNSEGCSATSQIITISLITATEEPQPADFTVSASPNPSSGLITVQLTGPKGKAISVTLSVLDLMSRVLYEKNLKFTGQHTELLNLSQHPTGLYLLKVATDTQQTMLRLIRQ